MKVNLIVDKMCVE